eukprot:scaffold5782_cov618-Prasinococcus_capsulatus_cf.AAC.6
MHEMDFFVILAKKGKKEREMEKKKRMNSILFLLEEKDEKGWFVRFLFSSLAQNSACEKDSLK